MRPRPAIEPQRHGGCPIPHPFWLARGAIRRRRHSHRSASISVPCQRWLLRLATRTQGCSHCSGRVHVPDLFKSSIRRATTSEVKITATPASAQKSRPGAKASNIAIAHPTSAPTKTFAVVTENSLSLCTTRAYPATHTRSCHLLVRRSRRSLDAPQNATSARCPRSVRAGGHLTSPE